MSWKILPVSFRRPLRRRKCSTYKRDWMFPYNWLGTSTLHFISRAIKMELFYLSAITPYTIYSRTVYSFNLSFAYITFMYLYRFERAALANFLLNAINARLKIWYYKNLGHEFSLEFQRIKIREYKTYLLNIKTTYWSFNVFFLTPLTLYVILFLYRICCQ